MTAFYALCGSGCGLSGYFPNKVELIPHQSKGCLGEGCRGIVSIISNTTSPEPAKARPQPKAREETTGGIEAILCGVVRPGWARQSAHRPGQRCPAHTSAARRAKAPARQSTSDDEGRASAAHGAAEVCARRLRLQVERVRGHEDGRMDSIEYRSEDRRAAGDCASAASQHEITGARCVSVMLMTG
jgi:hypothetical protein